MRGLPGSGKSTKAKKIAGEHGVIYSTDDFFMVNGQYVYDVKMIV
jgi:adenylate kinase family enzyme